MKIILNGEPYRIKFHYGEIKGLIHTTRSTSAELFIIEKDGTITTTTLLGFTSCDNRDNFVKELGRKNALKELLIIITDKFNLTKEDRTEIWNTYHSRDW